MIYALDRSEKVKIAGPIESSEDELPFYKYRAESDGRTFWAISGLEVWYSDERLYWALDEIWKLRTEQQSQQGVEG